MTAPLPSEPGRHSPRASAPKRPRIGVVKFASCDGCQLTLLDLEDELLAIAERVDLVEFAEATSRRSAGPYDVLFVEGSISTPEQADEIARLRAVTRRLVTIGACATAGGIQAHPELVRSRRVPGCGLPRPDYVESLARPAGGRLRGRRRRAARLPDLARPSCASSSSRSSRADAPQLPDEAVCLECKRRGIVCVAVARASRASVR